MKKKDENVLSEELIAACGLTPEEVVEFEDALSLAATAELLPDNEEKMYNKIDKVFPDDIDKGIDLMVEISKKDPDFFTQLVALTEINDSVRENPPAKIEKLSAGDIVNSQAKEIIDSLK